MTRLLALLTVLISLGLTTFSAQQPPNDLGPASGNDWNGPASENDPSRGVARLSLLNGEVSVRRGDSGDVVSAALNAPLVSQDRLLTSSSSRAEVQFDHGNVLRIGANSEVRLNDIQQHRFQVQIAIGTITFRLGRNSQSEGEIDTPSISFRPLRPGSYRVIVREDGSSEISIREGEAEIFGPRGTEPLRAGASILARGSADDPEFREIAPIALDDWDRWNQSRDHQLESSQSYDYVSPDITGAEDLEGYGRWTNDPQYGNVWVPRVEPGWAPYRAGRWVWEDYYGWTWVSYDPWGWAPYHYGRWYSGALGWAWYPGPRYSHHSWSPALVGFFGFGGYGGFHAGVGFGFGNVGWVPLAPNERFQPWWGRGIYSGLGGDRRFGNQTTIVNNTNITNIYRNARVNNGITAVGSAEFGRGQGRFVGMSGASIRDAGLVHGVLPVTPDRSSLRLADPQVRAGAFPQDRNIHFAGRHSSTPAARVPFDQQQRGMDQVARQTFGAGRGTGGTPVVSGSASPGANQGWRRSGDWSVQSQGAQQQPNQGGFSQRSGPAGQATHEWSRFGEPIHGSQPDSNGRTSGSAMYSGTTSSYSRSAERGSYSQSQQDSGMNGTAPWHRFGQPSSANGASQAAPQSSRQQPYFDSANSTRSAGSGRYQSSPQGTNPGYLQPARQYDSPVRISPSIVRERTSPDYSRSSSSGSRQFGGGGSSRPVQSSGGGGNHQSNGSGRSSNSSGSSANGHTGGRR